MSLAGCAWPSAQASGTLGVDGAYSLGSYVYDTLGRLTGLPGMGTYGYSSAHVHAVEKINGVTRYSYDSNGNMTQRIVGANTYDLSYDAENHLTGVSGSATNTYTYDGDGKRVKEATYENLALGMPLTSDVDLTWPEAAADGDTWADSGSSTSGEFAYISTGLHYAQVDLGAVYSVDKVKVWHYANDGRTYHNTRTEVSVDGTNWTVIFDSATQGEYAETAAGKTHTFTARSVRYVRDYLNGSTANEGNHWVEIEVYGSRTNLYLGDYFEWSVNDSAMRKYYAAGGVRVAQRQGSGAGTAGLTWLLADHLGSTTITASADGTLQSELRFKPWGELRFVSGATLTDRRYTGQRFEGTGLVDYGARFYDPSLSQFNQPDSLILDLYHPLDWNRYGYARYNPMKYNDPSGHWPEWLDNAIDFAQGAAYQYANDMTLGAVDKIANAYAVCMNCNTSNAYEQGQKTGRVVSTVVASTEFVLGAAVTGTALAAIPPATGSGLVCTAISGGLCALPSGAVVGIEAVAAVGGVVVAGAGAITIAYIKNNPVNMLGANGPQFTSKTLWQGKQGRLDVENPNPGKRPGQIHFQQGNNKWIYDPTTNSFRPARGTKIEAPIWLDDLLGQNDFRNAIQKGLRYLGND